MTTDSCVKCDEPMPADFEPEPCCDLFDCECQGMPYEPAICSEACWDALHPRGFVVIGKPTQ